jgi:hypothetical protein
VIFISKLSVFFLYLTESLIGMLLGSGDVGESKKSGNFDERKFN